MVDLWNENELTHLVNTFQNSGKKLILLDFDGTLIDFVSDPALAVPSDELSTLLSKLAGDHKNKIVIVTGRRKNDIDQKVGHLPIDIVAEHGAFIKENDSWKILVDAGTDWKEKVQPIFDNYTSQTLHSVLEEKKYSFAWHYRNVDRKTGLTNSRALIESLKEIALQYDLKIIDGKDIVEIIHKNIHKGLAANYFIKKHPFDMILCLGDDKTDEDMFEALQNNERAYSIKIGMGNSLAKYKLHNVQQVKQVLGKLLMEE